MPSTKITDNNDTTIDLTFSIPLCPYLSYKVTTTLQISHTYVDAPKFTELHTERHSQFEIEDNRPL